MQNYEMVEHEILDAMEEWLDDYIIQLETDTEPAIDPIETALETVRGQISTLQSQQENICEYLEKGIYTIEMFTKRNLALENEIKQLRESEEDLLKQKSEGKHRGRTYTDHSHCTAYPGKLLHPVPGGEEPALEIGLKEDYHLSFTG